MLNRVKQILNAHGLTEGSGDYFDGIGDYMIEQAGSGYHISFKGSAQDESLPISNKMNAAGIPNENWDDGTIAFGPGIGDTNPKTGIDVWESPTAEQMLKKRGHSNSEEAAKRLRSKK